LPSTSSSPFSDRDFDHHEQVIHCHDAEAGLQGIIAIHDTRLGPAAGGCRMQPYESPAAALQDVLRLSRGMTYKNALAGLPLGGGKCVIIADPSEPGKASLLRAMARHVQRLGGTFWTAVDVGVTAEDADTMAGECDFIFTRASQFPDGFRASKFTALGGFHGIRAAVNHRLGRGELTGVSVAVQGVGSTGAELTRLLVEAGARVVVADVSQDAVDAVVDELRVEAAEPSEIHAHAVDVFAPCALGGVINDQTIPQIEAKIVCGVANNQLARPEHGEELRARDITYAPDFVVNAGGVLGTSTVIFGQLDREASLESIRRIYDTVSEILGRSDTQAISTELIAEQIAMERIVAGAG
jgi:leucine dehydrogenase